MKLKMRLGWDAATRNAPQLAVRAEAAGMTTIVVHGRTRAQFYSRRADWTAAGAVKRAVRVPVIVNGDTPQSPPAGAALGDPIVSHHEAMLGFYGAELGLRVARQHLGCYLDGLAGGAALGAAA